MLKHINYQNILTTPFVAAKSRALYNIQGDDVVITEPNIYSSETKVSLDYVDYNFGDPILNRECNIALEQQGDDPIEYEEGIAGYKTFNSSSDERNINGTYKSLVHRQIKNAFYNTRNNPIEIFGVEHIDFPLSKTLRNLSDHFRMFSVPNSVFGDKIEPKSVKFYDNLLDDQVIIFDDGYQNLIGGYNLFSKIQEVRDWLIENEIYSGSSDYFCPVYDFILLTDPVDVYAELGENILFSVSASGAPRPITFQWFSSSYAMTDGGQISGSTGPTLYIDNVTFENEGTYSVRAHNAATKGATSSMAHLYIIRNPPIISNPNDEFKDIGSNFDFCVTVLGGSSPMYWQWQSGSTLLSDNGHYSGSNTSCLRVNNITLADSGSYRVMVSNMYGKVTSSWANGHVNMNIEHSAPVSIAFNSGDIWNAPPFPDFPLFNIGFQYGSIDNYITKEYGLSSVGFLSGSILEIPVPVSTPEENSIVYSTFLSGSVFDTIVPEPGGSDSQS
ncbi:MAG TPA: immunoglobulin domain-containing protein, partial [Bacteroidales bacterium]|nr:immunoglobulin domain-containing protein [Bacteroidales bacterium]